jgi:2-(3-amino-3-carboxypropyl)histidine synthase
MKTLFIPAFSNAKADESEINRVSEKLPRNIVLAYSIQYKDLAEEFRKKLSKKHNITAFMQVLGCSQLPIPKGTEALLLIGSGRFHAIALALETSLPIYIYNKELSQISEKEIEQLKNKKKTAYLKFLSSEKIGIIVSAKPGQENLERALKLKKQLKNKKSYLFIANEINTGEFENFRLNSWINTACPRLDMDFPIMNLEDLKKLNS